MKSLALCVGQTHRHDRQPLISSNQKDLTGEPEDLTGSRSPLLLKYHGKTYRYSISLNTNNIWRISFEWFLGYLLLQMNSSFVKKLICNR